MLTDEEMERILLEEMTNGTLLLNNLTMLLESGIFATDGEGGEDILLKKATSAMGSGMTGYGGVGRRPPSSPIGPIDVRVQIALYSIIFLLAILGNLAVILTLVQNQGMRTITNLFLLNLAIADLLVGVFCMPFTLVGIVLKEFVFGAVLCKLIPYLQAVSVSVSAWTLVAISVERYYAICHPLTSRRWQTLSHAYKIIAVVWILSMLCMSPIAFVSMLQPMKKTGRKKCREEWPDETLEKTYTVFLDMILLVLPLFIMAVKYGLITQTLWPTATHNDPTATEQSSMLGASAGEDVTPTASPLDPRITTGGNSNNTNNSTGNDHLPNALRRHNSGSSVKRLRLSGGSIHNVSGSAGGGGSMNAKTSLSIFRHNLTRTGDSSPPPSPSTTSQGGSSLRIHLQGHRGSFYGGQVQVNSQSGRSLGMLRKSNAGKSLSRKKRVIQMLGVVVLEFFICWTPLYVMNTWYLFSPAGLYDTIGPLGVSLVHLLSYISSCSNPITYCFMNKSFRVAFCHVFGCHCASRNPQPNASQRNDSLRLTRNRSLYASTLKATDDV